MHPCPLCGGHSRFAFFAVDRNRRISSERFSYNRCCACSALFITDIPVDLGRYYGGDYYQFDAAGEPLWKTHPGQRAAEAWRARALRCLVEPGRLIDVGAGTGGFVAAAQDGGFEATAVEMDSDCCRYISSRLGAEAVCSEHPVTSLRALPAARAVTLWHVLEHLRDPREMLAAAAGALEPGGVLALASPNPGSIQFRLQRTRWAHLDAPRHLCLMPGAAILRCARELDLEPIAQTTADPSGAECNRHGWVYGLRRDPSRGPARGVAIRAGTVITDILAPVERRGHRGAALTLFFRKSDD